MIALGILAAVYAAMLAYLAYLAVTAPMGWEDERGWHAGTPEGAGQ